MPDFHEQYLEERSDIERQRKTITAQLNAMNQIGLAARGRMVCRNIEVCDLATPLPKRVWNTPEHWIYVVGHDGREDLKIGHAEDPRSRLATIQTGYPYPLRCYLLRQFPSKADAKTAEQGLQALCNDHSHGRIGEWFSRSALSAISEAAGIPADWMRLHYLILQD